MSSNKSLTSSGGLHYKDNNRQMKLVVIHLFSIFWSVPSELILVLQYIAKDEENVIMCEKQAC